MKLRRLLIALLFLTGTLHSAEDAKPESKIEILVVRYAHSDTSNEENRLLIMGQSAYRSVKELTKVISVFSDHPEFHIFVNGTCEASDPRLTPKEIEEIKQACVKAGVQFTYYPAG